jgi:GT2 family glycosyltransferase
VLARAIAVAAAHPLGVGDALYRYARQAQEVDTVPFGAFRRSLADRIGGFDETLLSNEDYEFNVRIRQAGGKVWLDPAIRSTYFARSTLVELAKQYWRYGYWKVRMLRRYASTIRWRQALPPLFVLSLLVLGALSILFFPSRWILAAEVVSYSLVLFFVGARCALQERTLGLIFGVPLAIAIMHLFWGGAFLWSIFETLFRRSDDSVRNR